MGWYGISRRNLRKRSMRDLMNYDKPDMTTTLASFPSIHERLPLVGSVPDNLRRAGADFVSRGKVKIQSVESPGTNLCQLTGSVQCGFGIVHHPALTLARRGGQIQIEHYQCGCREGAAGRFCAHCAALLVAHYGHADAVILSEDQIRDQEEEAYTGIRIRLGTIQKTAEPVYWTPEDAGRLAAPNIAVVGREDTGNTQMAESVAIQLLRQKAQAGERIGLLLFAGLDDYSEGRTTFVDTTGAKVLRLHKLPVNPFSLRGLERKPQLHAHTAMSFADALARAYGLNALEKSTLVQCVIAAYAARGITSDPVTWDLAPPVFEDVYEEYCSRPQNQRSGTLAQVMETFSLLDLFDSESREHPALYDQIQGTVIMDMSGYPERLKHFALGIVLEVVYAQMCGQKRTLSRELQKMILIDNADTLLASGSAGLEGLLSQGREFGLGLLLSAQSLDGFRDEGFDYRKWIRTWVLHNVEDLRKADLEFLLQADIHENALDRLYQTSRRLQKLHSLIRIGLEEPVLAEDLPFYEIAEDAAQSYLVERSNTPEPEPLAGMPLLDAVNLEEDLVSLEELSQGPMIALEEL